MGERTERWGYQLRECRKGRGHEFGERHGRWGYESILTTCRPKTALFAFASKMTVIFFGTCPTKAAVWISLASRCLTSTVPLTFSHISYLQLSQPPSILPSLSPLSFQVFVPCALAVIWHAHWAYVFHNIPFVPARVAAVVLLSIHRSRRESSLPSIVRFLFSLSTTHAICGFLINPFYKKMSNHVVVSCIFQVHRYSVGITSLARLRFSQTTLSEPFTRRAVALIKIPLSLRARTLHYITSK